MASQIGFDVIVYTPSAPIATNGTMVFNYPAGRLSTDYAKAGEKIEAHGLMSDLAASAGNFSVSYGSSSATVTYLGATSLPAAKNVTLQLPLALYVALTDNSGGAASGGVAAGVGVSQIVQFINLADIAPADLLTALKPGYNGKILAVDLYIEKPATTGAKLATLTPKIDAVAVTGGVIAATSAAATPQGAKIAGSAVTATNTFGPTDTIGLTGSSVTAFAEGSGWVVWTVQNMDTANAFAALSAKVNTLISNDALFDRIPH